MNKIKDPHDYKVKIPDILYKRLSKKNKKKSYVRLDTTPALRTDPTGHEGKLPGL